MIEIQILNEDRTIKTVYRLDEHGNLLTPFPRQRRRVFAGRQGGFERGIQQVANPGPDCLLTASPQVITPAPEVRGVDDPSIDILCSALLGSEVENQNEGEGSVDYNFGFLHAADFWDFEGFSA
jgi:hypothetical protein